MRKIKYAMFLLLAMLFAGCINENIEPTFCRDGVLTFNMSTTAPGISRAEGEGEDKGEGDNDDEPNAESKVYDLHYFLYPKGSADSVNATYAGLITGIKANHGDNSSDNFEQKVSIPAGALNALFPNGATECDIYVIANYVKNGGSDLSEATDTKRATLKSLPIKSPTFVNGGAAQFVMDSEVFTVTRGTGTSSNTLTSETIYLTRAAAKIMIQVNVQTSIDVSGNIWEPVTEVKDANSYQMTLDFFNGVTEGIIDDDSDTAPSGKDIVASSENPYYHIEKLFMMSGHFGAGGVVLEGEEDTSGEVYSSWITMENLYSYTSAWKDDESDAPYFKLSIPWRKVEAGQGSNANWVTYDYEVPVAINSNQLARNKLYLIKLNVGALGDLDYLDPAVYSYKVLDWSTVEVDAELSRPKYLVVEETYVEVFNQENYSVKYSSSDAVSATIVSVSRDNLKNRIVKEDIRTRAETSGSSSGWNDFNNQDFSISTEGGVVTLSHKLDNDRNSDYFDYVPYEIVVDVVNESGLTERITFVQYPAMYVVADTNTDYEQNSDHGDDWENTWNDNHGYQWVNGYRGDDYNGSGYHYVTLNGTRVQYLASSNGLSSNAGNKNPNMYTITVSSFSDGSYVVGDPRTTHYDERLLDAKLGSSNYYVFASAPALSGTSPRRLQYYYPTDASAVTQNVISPKFRVASSYSVLGSAYLTSREVARRRCASYQEDGYPAGRWRMATAAEMQFMIQLSQQGLIPALFSTNTNYWCAHGVINYVTGAATAELDECTTNSDGGSIRCVYDEWYWGSEKAVASDANAKFTWGDELRPTDSVN